MPFITRCTRVCCVVFASAFVPLFAPRAGRAEPPAALRIEWPSVVGCPTRDAVTKLAIRAVAGTKELDRVLARADLTAPAGGEPWRVHIRMRTAHGSGERVLEARTCDELARATALLVALATVRMREHRVEAELEELAPAADRIEAPLATAAPLALSSERGPRVGPSTSAFVAGGGLFGDIGALPSVGFGPSLWLAWVLGSYRARLAFLVVLEQERLERALGATFGFFGASLELCRMTVLGALRPHACLGAEVDVVSATGIGDERFEAQRTSGFLFGGLGAEWSPTSRVRVGLDVRMGPSLRRPSFVVEFASGERRSLHEQAPVRGQALATLGLVF